MEAKGVERAARRERAERAIDLIGLDGFESAYPKELSGGMRAEHGDFHHIVTGVAVMSLYIVGVNRLLWCRLYRLAETRYWLS